MPSILSVRICIIVRAGMNVSFWHISDNQHLNLCLFLRRSRRKIRFSALARDFCARFVAQADGRSPALAFRCNRLAYRNGDDAAAREPVAVAQDGAGAAYAHRHDGYARFGSDDECAHAERHQAGYAAERALREEYRAAAGLQRKHYLFHVFQAALRFEALDEIRADALKIGARYEAVQQFALGDETEIAGAAEFARQRCDEHDAN